jgi:Bacterial TniB protein
MKKRVKTSASFSHLNAALRAAAALPDSERVMHIRADRWIGYPRAIAALARLEALLNWPRKQRMPNLLLIDPTNNGKSMIIEKFLRGHRAAGGDADRESVPIVAVQMPSDPSINRFYAMLLAALGAPLRPRMRTPELEHQAIALLRAVGARILIIDELHNILAGPMRLQLEFLNLIRFLGNELKIPIIGVGTKEAYLAIRSDSQLENRFEPVALPVWQEGDEVRSLLSSFAASYPLRRPSVLGTETVARYLLARSEGTIGEIAQLLRAAAIAAIESGAEAIIAQTLTLAHYESPSQRRQAFERELA